MAAKPKQTPQPPPKRPKATFPSRIESNSHRPTLEQRDQVMALVYLETEPAIIAKLLGVFKETLFRKYRNELRDGAAIVRAKLGMKIVAAATNGDKAALAQIARAQQIGRSEPPKREQDGKGDNETPIDLGNLSDANLNGILAALVTSPEGGVRGGNKGGNRKKA